MMNFKFLVTVMFIYSTGVGAETRLCEKKKPFPARYEMVHLSNSDYEYKKHIYELSYDEIKGVSYKKYKNAIQYFDKDLANKIKEYGNLFNSAELSGTYRYHISAIEAYTLRQKALVEKLTTGKGEAVKEFCDYLSGLKYHP